MDNAHKFSHSQPIADDRPGEGGEYYDQGDLSYSEILWKRCGVEAYRGHMLKYTLRAGYKPGNPPEQDFRKNGDWAIMALEQMGAADEIRKLLRRCEAAIAKLVG